MSWASNRIRHLIERQESTSGSLVGQILVIGEIRLTISRSVWIPDGLPPRGTSLVALGSLIRTVISSFWWEIVLSGFPSRPTPIPFPSHQMWWITLFETGETRGYWNILCLSVDDIRQRKRLTSMYDWKISTTIFSTTRWKMLLRGILP
jgi:hypothetical protein